MKAIHPSYYRGLAQNDAKKQKKYIRIGQQQYKREVYKTRPVPKSYRHRRSKHLVNFERIYGISIKNAKKISDSLGVSASKQKRILSKGRGAYFSSGSRPGQTPSSWAYARLASALLGRGACKVDQHILAPLRCKDMLAMSAKSFR